MVEVNPEEGAIATCVTATDDVGGAEPWLTGFSLETRDGVSLHAEPPHEGPTIREGDRARRR